jgi:8-oxo-dGTP diphosphatase
VAAAEINGFGVSSSDSRTVAVYHPEASADQSSPRNAEVAMNLDVVPYVHTQIVCANVFIRRGDQLLMLKRSSTRKYAPGCVHPVGGKVDPNENPYEGARREVLEETGLTIKDLRLEAVLLDIQPVPDEPYNWLVYHFSADYDSGTVIDTDEGELIWLAKEEVPQQPLHPSVQPIIGHILDSAVGTVFVTYQYDEGRNLNPTIECCACN